MSDPVEHYRPRLSGKTLGRLCVVVAAVMWSTNGLFVKSHLFDEWNPSTRGTLLSFYRGLFAGLLLLPAVRRPRWDIRLIPMVVAFTAMSVTFLQAMTLTTAANAIWLQSTAPLWVFLFSRTLYRDTRDPRDLVPLGCGLAGAATILTFELRANSLDSSAVLGVILALMSGVTYAFVVVSIRALRDHSGAFVVAVNHLAAAVILLPYCLYLAQPVSAEQLVALAAFGFFQMGVPYLLFARGLREISGQEAAAIGLLEPVLTPLWVYLMPDGERPAPWTIAGAALILIGLALRYTRAERTGETEKALLEAPGE